MVRRASPVDVFTCAFIWRLEVSVQADTDVELEALRACEHNVVISNIETHRHLEHIACENRVAIAKIRAGVQKQLELS